MSKKFILLSLVTTLFFSCKSNKSTSSTQAQKVEAQNPETTVATTEVQKTDSAKEELYRFTVTFYSIGEGTENKYMTGFEDFIGIFSGKVGKNIDYERTPWGREGETDYCLKLKELTPKEQTDFILRTNELLKGAKWVHVYENQPCLHKRKR